MAIYLWCAAALTALLARHDMSGYPISMVRGRARQAAIEARSRLEIQAGRLLIPFDVDVIASGAFPPADGTQPQHGSPFGGTLAALRGFSAGPSSAGLVAAE